MTFNRLLTDKDRVNFKPLIDDMFRVCPEMMGRKIARANVQQAFVLDCVKTLLDKRYGKPTLMASIGCFEDTAYEYLLRTGTPLVGIDSAINFDMHTFTTKIVISESPRFDILFSTSVLEHVEDDEEFMRDMCTLLNPGGYGILTVDYNNNYKPGDMLPYSDRRFYTKYDLDVRLRRIIEDNNCWYVITPDWSGEPDFEHDGCKYSFATLVFKRKSYV